MVRIIEGESSSSNRRRRRRPIDRGAERLSTMPQHILIEILSRLSTLDAARVSFGSRIWMTTWRSLPNLIFYYSQFPAKVNKAHSFLRFVNWTIAHHDDSNVKILELRLGPMSYCEVLINYQWVEFAIQHSVQKLVLHGRICGTQNLAYSIFSCRSLVKLELALHELALSWPETIEKLVLHGRICGTQNLAYSIFSCRSLVKLELALHELALSWPETIELPNLRKLKLKFLLLSEMIPSQDLFSKFPALEKLSMFFCNVTSFNIFSISSSRLTQFTMSNCPGMENCLIRLQTPSLSKFVYVGCVPRENVLQVPPCAFQLVVDGDDSCTWTGSQNELSRTIVKLTRGLFGTRYMSAGRWLIQYLSMVPELPRRLASDRFNYLVMLTISLWPVARHVKTLMLLVSKCPILSVLSISFETPQGRVVNRGGYIEDYEGVGVFGGLTDITIKNLGGNGTEMMLARHLLARSPHLHKMKIEMNPHLDDVDVDLKIHQILECWKASPDANLMFD
ncbi:F-box/FBD/LRR-repeat protein [Sesamum alatum]|uniref:F-box/FBD/LRR-repeat protein n=1 Tax=Sesamum alatum TaxID=300844 RepID=A0AAE1XP09_9LAMI|nr:F-box/FBD/LRR-repeat protein [Sesamum alatum]